MHSQNNIISNLSLLLIFLYVIIYPFFIFNSGTPQIADFILMFVVIINLRKIFSVYNSGIFTQITTHLLLYICFINLIWGWIYSDTTIYFNIFFYLYNLLVFLLIVYFLRNIKYFPFVFCTAILISYIIQEVLSPYGRENGIRNILFFNNPNQLGLWAILTFFILYIYFIGNRLNGYFFTFAFLSSFFFIILSISKASIITIILFSLYFFISNFKKSFIPMTIAIFAILYFVKTNNIGLDDIQLIDNLILRVESDNSSDDTLGGRGYDRIWNHPLHNLFGAGEGANYRFVSQWYGEIHSALGTLLFCYGIFGITSFIFLMYLIFKKNDFNVYVIVILVNIYMTVHLGLRSAFLWILFAHLYYFKDTLLINSKKYHNV
mgnify:FL=1|jgi:hypothetical protein